MANEDRKDFNAMLNDDKGMPRIQIITDEASIRRYGGSRMYLAPPLAYDGIMRLVPFGRLTTVGDIRAHLAQRAGADFTDPITAGIFVSIAAWASSQRVGNPTPWWHAEGEGRAEPQIPRRHRGAARAAGGGGAPHRVQGKDESAVLRRGLRAGARRSVRAGQRSAGRFRLNPRGGFRI